MADYEERSSDDLTEEPSQYRLEELRSKGIVSQSKEITSTVILIGLLVLFYITATVFVREYSALLKLFFVQELLNPTELKDWPSLVQVFSKPGRFVLVTLVPVGILSLVLAVLTSVAQVGFIYSTDTIAPDMERVNPIAGLKRLFSMQNFTNSIKSIIKLLVIGGTLYFAVKSQFLFIPQTLLLTTSQLITYIGTTTFKVFSVVAVMLVGTGAFDYWIQWREYRKRAMMTKYEAKKEQKEREGDPQIKARIRTIQRDMARKRMMKSVPTADVIVTNPTHFAIAIQYDSKEMFAPKVVAKGADFLAERIKQIGRENGIPMVENKPLARSLYKHVKVGQIIPRSLYQAVAEILAYVYKLRGKRVQQNPAVMS